MRPKCFETVRKVYSTPSADSDDGCLILNQMVFCSLKAGWAAGLRQVIRSVDGGKTWVNKYEHVPHALGGMPWKVAPVNSAVCWLAEWNSSSSGRVCKTVDGGESWKSFHIDDRACLKDICFLESEVGWMLGSSGPAHQLETYLFHTGDGGRSWQRQSVPEAVGTPSLLRFTTDGVGFLAAHRDILKPGPDWSYLYTSQNYGRSWNLAVEFDCNVNTLLLDDANRVYIGDDEGNVKQSEDRGNSWVQVARLNGPVHVVAFDNRGHGFIAGDSDSALVSKDRGSSWTEYSFAGLVTAVGDAHFAGNNELVITGTAGIYVLSI